MATVNLIAYSFDDLSSTGLHWPWAMTSAGATSVSLTSQKYPWQYMVLNGDFTVGANNAVSGTVTSLLQTGPEWGTEVIRIDGLAVDAAKLLDLITNQPDPQQMFAYLLSGDDTISGTYRAETLAGFGGNDTFNAGPGDDTILAGGGDDVIHGGDGIDTVTYAGMLADYRIEHIPDGLAVTSLRGDTGTDTLDSIEKIVFADKMFLPVDVNGPTGEIFRLYHAAFGRVPDAAGLEYWTAQVEKGLTLDTIAGFFVGSWEYQQLYGSGMSNADLVGKFYEHILGRAPEKAGLDYWVGILDSHQASVAFVLATISESPEHVQVSVPLIGNGVVTDLPVMTI